jgi:hypothetical protein
MDLFDVTILREDANKSIVEINPATVLMVTLLFITMPVSSTVSFPRMCTLSKERISMSTENYCSLDVN